MRPLDQSRDAGPRPGDRIAGKYRVQGVIGQGGMGRVLAATNEATGKRVALKWLLDPSADAAARFAREARAAGRIHHPNVVDVYDVVEHEGATCLVMELLHGESLAGLLAREHRLSIAETVAIGVEIARGVEAAHREGVIHRDLKPGNLFLCERDPVRVKILDFGISKVVTPGESASATHSGIVLGTPDYMAPEQVRGVKELDHRVDVYALGAVLYAMLTGRPPHQHTHVPALLVEIATVAPLPVELVRPDVPPALAEIVGRALAKEPGARFETAGAMGEALRALVALAPSAPASHTPMRDVETLPTARAKVPAPHSEETAPTLHAATPGALPALAASPIAAPPSTASPSTASPSAASPSAPAAPTAGEAVDTVDAPVRRAPRLLAIALVALALAAVVALGARSTIAPVAETTEPVPISRAAPSAAEPAPIEPTLGAAAPDTPATEPEVPAIAEPTAAGASAAEPERSIRARRRATARSAPEEPAIEPAIAEPEPAAAPSSSRAPRAGRIALDDF